MLDNNKLKEIGRKRLQKHTHRFTALLEFVRDHPGEQVQKGKTRKVKTNLD